MKIIRNLSPLAAALIAIAGATALPAHAQREGDTQAEIMRQNRQDMRQQERMAQRYSPFGPSYRGSGREANDWLIDQQLSAAAQRIDRGRGNGITKKEAKRLNAELDNIRNRVNRMRADGRMDRRERDDIDRRLSQLAQNTRNQRFD